MFSLLAPTIAKIINDPGVKMVTAKAADIFSLFCLKGEGVKLFAIGYLSAPHD